jgi:hypothetical protein
MDTIELLLNFKRIQSIREMEKGVQFQKYFNRRHRFELRTYYEFKNFDTKNPKLR